MVMGLDERQAFDHKSYQAGDLVKYVAVVETSIPQTWQKKEGIGIIIFKNSETFTYTVLSGGQSFDCIEVCGI